jgi:CheY-like chemotaxis protein
LQTSEGHLNTVTAPKEAKAMQPKHLLIIDDEDHIREVASLSLEVTEGWHVSTANCGTLGVALARREKPDAILLDVMMPDKDGPATLRELQSSEETRAIPVIFLTAKIQGPDRRRFIELGVRGVIAKPFDPLTLGQQIRDSLGWSALNPATAGRTAPVS